MDRLTKHFFAPSFNTTALMDEVLRDLGVARKTTNGAASWTPRVTVRETADAYLIEAELPGLKPEEVDVTFERGLLTLRGERKREETQEGETFHVYERSHGSFERTFRFSDRVDAEGIEARSEHGVLTITVKKTPATQPRKIAIQGAAPQADLQA